MTSRRRSAASWSSAVLAAVGAIALGAVTNIFTGALPTEWHWAHDWRLTGAAFTVISFVTIAALLWQHAQSSRGGGDIAKGGILQRVLDRFTSRYERSYRRWTTDDRRNLESTGLHIVGPFSPELEAVFVDVKLTSREPDKVSAGLIAPRTDDTGRTSVWEFLNQQTRVVLLVLGAPGSGKTTLLSHVAYTIATEPGRMQRPVPVLLHLRNHAVAISEQPDVSLPTRIRAAVPGLIHAEPPGWWEKQLRLGRCVLLLDGLDEIADDGARRAVVRWINGQAALHPGNDFIVASRPHDYRGTFVTATATVEVQPFTPAQVEKFLHRWYCAAERHKAQPAKPDEFAAADLRGAAAADHLISQLDGMPKLQELTTNPLLLTMIANVHQYKERLPENRAILYREVCSTMLWRRDEARDRPSTLSGRQRTELLGGLALDWMQAGIRELSRRELLDLLKPRLAEIEPESSPDEALVELERTGLLLAPRDLRFTFAHQTFQEYLAAAYIAMNSLDHILINAVDEPWWRETTLLYTSENDPNPIILGALEFGSTNALSLAFEIAEAEETRPTAVPVSENLWKRLDAVLGAGLRPTADPDQRVIMADVLVARLVRTLTAPTRPVRVSRRPVSAGLYRLFCTSTGTPWPEGPAFDAGEPNRPARGLWRTDADAFIAWVNMLVATGQRHDPRLAFRLPRENEVTTPTADGPTWISTSQGTRAHNPAAGDGADVDVDALLLATASDLRGSRLLATATSTLALQSARMARTLTASVASQAGKIHEIASRDNVVDSVHLRLSHLLIVTDSLTNAVKQLPIRDSDLASEVSGILGSIDLTSALRHLSDAEANSTGTVRTRLRTEVLRARSIGSALAEAGMVLAQAGDQQTSESPVDRIIAPTTSFPPFLPMPHDFGDPADALASAIVPLMLREERRSVHVDLPGLAAKVQRMSALADCGRPASDGSSAALQRLVQAAGPLVDRRQPITQAGAAVVRAPALIIARAARQTGDSRLAADLVELAAAMVLLQKRRRSSQDLETLFLAYG